MITEFEVDVWGGTMYERIAQVYEPSRRLAPNFNVSHLDLSHNPTAQNLFHAMDLTIYPRLDKYRQYSSVFQAGYSDLRHAIWTPDQTNNLRGMLETKNYEVAILEPQEGVPPMLKVDYEDQACLLRTFTVSDFDRSERVLEIIFARKDKTPLVLEDNEAQFLKRVVGWGELIKDVVKSTSLIKAQTQTGVLRIGTVHFMPSRSALEDELGL